jgi:hypothetical protein
MWRQCALGNQLEKELDLSFPRRRGDGVGPLYTFALDLNPKRGILAGNEFEITVAADTNHPQVGREVRTLYDLSLEKSLVHDIHGLNSSSHWSNHHTYRAVGFSCEGNIVTRDGLRWEV